MYSLRKESKSLSKLLYMSLKVYFLLIPVKALKGKGPSMKYVCLNKPNI